MTKAYSFGGSTMTVLVSGKDTEGAFAILHVIKPSGSSTPPHSHDDETEVSYVLSGSLGVETEGHTAAIGAGDVAVLPPTRPHRLFNNSGATVREFLLCAPARFDQFVAAVSAPTAPYGEPRSMTEEDRRRLVETAPQFGIRLLTSAAPLDAPRERAQFGPEILGAPGGRAEVLARLGDGEHDLVVLRQILEPGRSVPLHSHADPECFFVTDGELEIYHENPDRGWRQLRAEEAAYVGANVRHAVRNSGTVQAGLLVITTVRVAHFFAAIGSPSAEPAAWPQSAEEYATFFRHAAARGFWFATADESATIGLKAEA